MSAVVLRVVGGLLGAAALFTGVWIAWGLATPGDYFGNGSAFVKPTLALGAAVGFIAGFVAVGRWRFVVYSAAAVSASFWVLAPSGWWAHGA